jgi:hypothetical protein
MPGLIQQQQQPQQPQPAQQSPAQNPVVQRVEIAAKKILAQPQVAKQIIAIIQQAQGNPAQGIAQATIFLLKLVFGKAKGLPQQAIPACIAAVAIDVARAGSSAGLYQLTPELAKEGAMVALQMYAAKVKERAQAQPAPQEEAEPQEETAPGAEAMEGE